MQSCQRIYKQSAIGLLLIAIMCAPLCVSAHGDLDIRINEATQQIKLYPDSAELYMHRANLYLQHVEYNKSIVDLSQAETLGYADPVLFLLRSKSYRGVGDLNQALEAVNQFVSHIPHHVLGRIEKGRVLAELNQHELAALEFEAVISLASKTFPENYLDAANSWALTETPEGMQRAISVLEQGRTKLGHVTVLQERLRDYFMTTKAYDKAMQVQEEIISSSNRKEFPFYHAALILAEEGNHTEALNLLD